MSNNLVITSKRKQFTRKKLSKEDQQKQYLARNAELLDSVKVSSTIATEEETVHSYTPTIAWGGYDIKSIVEKMVLFSEYLTGMKLHPYQIQFQKRVFESILLNDGEEITALFARQSGKTETIACAIDTLMSLLPVLGKVFPKQLGHFSKGIRVGLFAGTGEQAFTTHERMDMRLDSENAKEILNDPDVAAVKKYANGSVTVKGADWRSFCKLQSAAKQTKIESKTYDLLVIEECQDIDELKIQKCYKYDTPINLQDGTMQTIEQVVKRKDQVILPSGNGKTTRWLSTGKQLCFKLKLGNGRTLSITKPHRHLIFKKGWKKPHQETTTEIRHRLGKGESVRVAIPDSLPYFGKKGTTLQGELLGRLLGDGSFTVSPVKYCGNKTDWDRINRCCPKGVKVSLRKKNTNNLIEGSLVTPKNNANPVIEWLRELKLFGLRGKDKFIPNLPWSREFLQGLVCGLFETDGCVESSKVKPILSYAGISYHIVKGLQDALLKFGVHSRIFLRDNSKGFSKKESSIWILHVKDVLSIKKFHSAFRLASKQSKLEIAYKTIKDKKTKNRCKYYPDHLRFSKIVSLENDGLHPTYCVTVNTPEHLLIANGIVSGNSIHPMGASTNATIVKIGTSTNKKCEFYSAIRRNKAFQSKLRIQNHFEFDYKTVQKYNPKYKAFIRKEMERLGIESDAFRMAYSLEWILEKGMALTPVQFDEYLKMVGYRFEYENHEEECVAGLDLGRHNDSTVITILKLGKLHQINSGVKSLVRTKTVINWLELIQEGWESQIEQIQTFLGNYNITQLAVDATGVGDPIVERLQHLMGNTDINIIPVKFSEQVKNEMTVLFYEEMRARRLQVPAHQSVKKTRRYKNFCDQWFNAEKIHRRKYTFLQHPDEPHAHDDYVDSYLLALYASEKCHTARTEMYHENALRTGNVGRSKRYQDAMKHMKRSKVKSSYRSNRMASFRKKVSM